MLLNILDLVPKLQTEEIRNIFKESPSTQNVSFQYKNQTSFFEDYNHQDHCILD